MPSPTIKGTITTISWGTSGVLQSPLNTAIVKSVKRSDRGGAPIEIQDNDGYTAIVVDINDGDDIEITVMDDTSKTWPAKGAVISLKGPNDAAAKNFLVTETSESAGQKTARERTFKASHYTAITLT